MKSINVLVLPVCLGLAAACVTPGRIAPLQDHPDHPMRSAVPDAGYGAGRESLYDRLEPRSGAAPARYISYGESGSHALHASEASASRSGARAVQAASPAPDCCDQQPCESDCDMACGTDRESGLHAMEAAVAPQRRASMAAAYRPRYHFGFFPCDGPCCAWAREGVSD